jgi:hypothetical protein
MYIHQVAGHVDLTTEVGPPRRLLQARKEFDRQMIDDRQIDEQDNV